MSDALHVEVELKYRVVRSGAADRFVTGDEVAGFHAVGQVRAIQYEDRYVDTPDAALARAGFGVRLRQAGTGFLVSMKSLRRTVGPSGAAHRDELEGPADKARPPADWPSSPARSLVLELAGDAPLVEVVTVRQLRRKRRVPLRRHAGRGVARRSRHRRPWRRRRALRGARGRDGRGRRGRHGATGRAHRRDRGSGAGRRIEAGACARSGAPRRQRQGRPGRRGPGRGARWFTGPEDGRAEAAGRCGRQGITCPSGGRSRIGRQVARPAACGRGDRGRDDGWPIERRPVSRAVDGRPGAETDRRRARHGGLGSRPSRPRPRPRRSMSARRRASPPTTISRKRAAR